MPLTPADDGFHPFGSDPFWQESWYYDWSSPDGSVAGFARQGYYPNLGQAWFWLYVFVDGRAVAVRDHEVPLGDRFGKTEHRTHGLWWNFHAQEPLVAWSLQAECFGIGADAAADLYDGEVGQPTPVALDISFEAIAPPYQWTLPAGRPQDDDDTPTSRFEQFGRWSGEVSIGDRVVTLDGLGERDHSWGRRDWWTAPWVYTAWNAGPDFAVHAAGTKLPGIEVCDGYVFRDGTLHPVVRFERESQYGDHGEPVAAHYLYADADGFEVEVDVTAAAVVPVPIEERPGSTGPTHFRRGPALFQILGGASGRGEIEYNCPQAGPFAGHTG